MIYGPARWWLTTLALSLGAAAATPVAAAARFTPTDPSFVVADVSRSGPDDALGALVQRWRASGAEADAVVLAEAYLERARSMREPRYFGRAEAVLAPVVRAAGAGAEARRLYADTLQFRHEFSSAEALLDGLLREQPRDVHSRLRRGSLRLTRGDFAGARADCAPLALARGAVATAGIACLAEALAGAGELPRARLLLDSLSRGAMADDSEAAAYLLSARAELAERAGDLRAAIADYRQALALAPADDAVRAALADALVLGGEAAGAILNVDNPSLALVVRSAALPGAPASAAQRARRWLELEGVRGDAIHHRELALLELAQGRAAEALAAASRNFESQRELADVRVLARAVMRAGDSEARRRLDQWLSDTGYADAVTEAILAGGRRG